MKVKIKTEYLDDESISEPLRNIKITYDDIVIYTKGQLDGYGSKHWDEYYNYIRWATNGRKLYKGLEWCCGPAYFAIPLLKYNVVDYMVMSDIHSPLKKYIEASLRDSKLLNRGEFIESNNFKNIPKQKFDLIIGNPPHFNWNNNLPDWNNPEEYELYHEDRKFIDNEWNIHKDFFDNVNDYIKDNGDIVLLENIKHSDLTVFEPMLKKNNLKIIHSVKSNDYPDDIWYIHIRKDL